MSVDLTHVLQAAAQGPLTTLDLTGEYSAVSKVAVTQMSVIGTTNQKNVERQMWDTVVNHQGNYARSWKIPMPSDTTDVAISHVQPFSDGDVIVAGFYGTSTKTYWVMVFDREGKCLMKWQPQTPLANSSIYPLPGRRVAVLVGDTLHILSNEGVCVKQWKPPQGHIIGVFGFPGHELVVHTRKGPYNANAEHSLQFFDSQLNPTTFSHYTQVHRFTQINENQVAVVTATSQNGQGLACYLLDKSGKILNQQLFPSEQVPASSSRPPNQTLLEITDKGIIIACTISDSWSSRHSVLVASWEGTKRYGRDENTPCPDASFTNYPGTVARTIDNTTIFIKQDSNRILRSGESSTDGNSYKVMSSDGYAFTWSKDEVALHYDQKSADPLQPVNFQRLWEALSINKTVTTCHLLGLPLGDEGARGIANVLRENSTLTQVDLSGTDITDTGARFLLSALKANRTIILFLNGNPITERLMDQVEGCITQRTRPAQLAPIPPKEKYDLPKEVTDPGTFFVFWDPVSTMEGDTYEREFIEGWFEEHNTCPNSNAVLENKTLIPNKALVRQLTSLHQRHPTLLHSGKVYFPKRPQIECLDAARRGDTATISRLVERDPRLLVLPLKKADGTSQTLLSVVLDQGPTDLLQLVLRKMGPVGLQRLLNETQDGGVGFFRQAALKLGRDAAKWVGQALGWNGSDYADRLFEALDEGNYELVDVCAQIAPLDALEKRGNTALHIAVKNGDRRMIELLLRHGAPLHALNIDGFSPLTMAEKQGNDELVSFMNLQCQAAAMAPVLQPLLDQIEKLRKEIETLKKPTGITPLTTPGGSTPTGPTGRTLPAIAGTMLPSPAASASTPGASAASSAQVGKKKSGKQPAASPPTTTRELPLSVPGREQALIKAAKSGDLDYVRQLVAAGTSVNAKNLEDETPLIVASTRGKDAVVEFLISNNADLDAERKEQSRQIDPFSPKDTEKYGLTIEMARTAVEIAAECGHKAIVRKLVAAGAQLTRQYSMWNEQGQRVTSTYSAALIGATRKGYTDLADLFIEKGVQLAVSFQKRSGNAITLADYILFSAIEDKKGTVVQWILPFYEKLKFDRIYSETRDSQTQQVTTITIGQEAMVLAVDHDALDILGFLVEKEVVNLNQSFRSAYSSQDRYSRTTTVVPEQTFGQYLEEKASNEYKSEIYKFLTSKGIESQF